MATERSQATPTDRGQAFLEWFQVRSWILVTGAAIVVVAGAGYWFFQRSRQIRTINAERSLMTAQQSLASGNNALAQSDLQKVIGRYQGTAAGTQAAMLLAQMDYDQAKYQEGINQLQRIVGDAAGSQPAVLSLIADGYSQMGKAAEAAKNYTQDAAGSALENERAYYRAKAARSHATAGNTSEAKKVWSELAKDEKSPAVAAEARVRLAGLDAKRAGRLRNR